MESGSVLAVSAPSRASTMSKKSRPTSKSESIHRKRKAVGLLQPLMKKIKIPESSQWTQHLTNLNQVVCGIDLSLTNPGLCVINPSHRTIHLFSFRNRVCESNSNTLITDPESIFAGWLLKISVIESDQSSDKSYSLFRFQRYQEKLQIMVALINYHCQSHQRIVGIEGYSYQSGAGEADTILKELGGCLRLLLCKEHQMMEIPPATIKKLFSGKGHAKKPDMYQAYRNQYHMPDLFTLLHIKEPSSGKTPHPIEDLVDAFAVALSTLYLLSQ